MSSSANTYTTLKPIYKESYGSKERFKKVKEMCKGKKDKK
jgi:hypothetical protein